MLSVVLVAGLVAGSAQEASVDTTIVYRPGATVRIINANGRIVVRGGEGNTIRIRVTLPPGDRLDIDRSSGLQVQRVASGGAFTARPSTMELEVPRGAPLDLLGQQTEVDIAGTQARVAVRTREGSISLRGGRGVVNARTVNGSITVIGADGAIDLRSTSRTVTIDSSAGDLTIETRSGDIITALDRFRSVKATSLSGHVRLRGVPPREGAVEAATHSGDVRLEVPAGANAEIRAQTTNGRIVWRLAVAAPRGRTESRIVLGNGGGSVSLRSFGGVVEISGPPR